MKDKNLYGQKKSLASKPPTRPVPVYHLSNFGLLNRNGLEIPSGIELVPVERDEDSRMDSFAAWSMPEQREGFIQVKKHDFF